MPVVIAKNTTTSDIMLEGLGIAIPGSSVINLTDSFEWHKIASLDYLKIKVELGEVVLNDGINDLNKADGLNHITYETKYKDEIIVDKNTSLPESRTYSVDWEEKLKVDYTSLEESNYLLSWSFEIKSNDNTINNYCEARILVNSSNSIATNSWLYAKHQYFNGIDIGKLTGAFSISIEYRRQGNYQPVYIRNAKISLIKLN